MGGGGGGGEGEPEFQIAPIIDVLLTLLVFFMSITTSQVEQIDKDIKLPVAPHGKVHEVNPNEAIINMKWDTANAKGSIKYANKEFDDMEDLKTVLESQKAIKPNLSVLIRGDRDLPAKEIQKVMQAAGLAGIDSIGFSTYNR